MGGLIPNHFIDDLLARTDIVDLLETYVPLRKAGKDHQGLCPFHNEKTPSFTVSREKQFYHCFGCGAHGSAIGFLMNYRSLAFPEAVEELATAAGLEIPYEASEQRRRQEPDLFALLQRASGFYQEQLRRHPERQRAVDYLKGRGLSGEIAATFKLGYAPPGWRSLSEALTDEGITEAELDRAGLVIKRDAGGHYDRFRDRIVFPIHDRRGRTVAFGGRVIDSGEPKYLNSPETGVFQKRRELYGLHEVLLHRRKPEAFLVVEGYMDVIALHQHGITHAVATLGTALTTEHLEQLFRQAPELVFCFDGDEAGRRAAWKALETSLPLMAGDRQVRFAFLPDGHDPDSAVRTFGADEFVNVANTFQLSEFLLERLKARVDLSSGEGRARLYALAVPYLRNIPSDAQREPGIRALAQEAGFDERLVRQELSSADRHSRVHKRPIAQFTHHNPLLQNVTRMLIREPQLADHIGDADAALLREEIAEAKLLLELIDEIKRSQPATTAALLERWREREGETQIAELLKLPLEGVEANPEQELRDAWRRLLELAAKRQRERLAAQVTSPSAMSEEEKQTLRERYKAPVTSHKRN